MMPATKRSAREDVRVLYMLLSGLDNFHGASKHVLGLSGAIAEQGVPVRLLCASDGLGVDAPGREIVAVAPDAKGSLSVARKLFSRARRDPWLRLSGTVIYARAHHLGFAFVASAFARRTPFVVEINGMPEFASIEQRTERRSASFARRAKLSAAVATMRVSYSLMLSRAAAIFVNNAEAKEYLVENRRLDKERVHVIPLGYDPAHARPRPLEACRRTLGLPLDERLIVHVGSLYGYKGADTLLEAFIRLRLANTNLILVGDGGYRAVLEQRVRDAGLGDRVRFLGERPFHETPLWAGAADVAVGLSNIDPQWACCPTKVVEYAACGVPVVTNTMAITRELARGAPISLIDDARSTDQVARALSELLDADPRALRVHELSAAVTRFAWPEIGRKSVAILSSLVANTSGAPDSAVATRCR
ncbi:MAG: hypothetical protein BMS9Abin37_0569 [Acidobacteriota bacterium]|nr:MAG: hypothetical protein BMS9Abin37_0569 [Acidobacteriota bacterium]